jgi:2-keto-4-pentenoate hydratase
MPALDPRQKAEQISAIFRARQPIDILPAELIPADLDESYQVRDAYQAMESAAGRGAVAGDKIGLTTPIMQKLCGVDEPCFGAIFTNEVHHRRGELPIDAYCRLGVETEIAVRLGEDLPQDGDRVRVEGAAESCMAAIELLEDLRQDYRRLSAAAMVAGQRMERWGRARRPSNLLAPARPRHGHFAADDQRPRDRWRQGQRRYGHPAERAVLAGR